MEISIFVEKHGNILSFTLNIQSKRIKKMYTNLKALRRIENISKQLKKLKERV